MIRKQASPGPKEYYRTGFDESACCARHLFSEYFDGFPRRDQHEEQEHGDHEERTAVHPMPVIKVVARVVLRGGGGLQVAFPARVDPLHPFHKVNGVLAGQVRVLALCAACILQQRQSWIHQRRGSNKLPCRVLSVRLQLLWLDHRRRKRWRSHKPWRS